MLDEMAFPKFEQIRRDKDDGSTLVASRSDRLIPHESDDGDAMGLLLKSRSMIEMSSFPNAMFLEERPKTLLMACYDTLLPCSPIPGLRSLAIACCEKRLAERCV